MDYLFKPMLSAHVSIRVMEKGSYAKAWDHLDFHPHFEMYFCPQALSQRVIVNGEPRTVMGPNVIITSPYSVHIMHPEDYAVDLFERHVVYFDKGLFAWFNTALLPENFLSEDGNQAFFLTLSEAEYLLGVAKQWYREGISPEEQGLYFAAFLLALDRMVPTERRETLDHVKSEIPSVLKFINCNLDGDLSFRRITREFGISRAKLNRDFRNTVGESLHRTVINCRLSAAVRMLKQTSLSVCEIAAACGFESEQYFYAFFKRNMGVTPNSVRKKQRQKDCTAL